jgi:hypothetical protein|tara:strand:- start:1341 stop:1922 length:582 start_codon:yes stop_codon:yes gene_type:complete
MEILITLAVKFWQWSILIALIIIGSIINLFDKKVDSRVNFKYSDYPLMKPLRIATKGKGFFKMILMWLLGVRHWEIAKDFHYELDGQQFVIPAGFKFDGASIPKFLHMFLSPVGVLLIGGLVHDYAYKYETLLHKNKKDTMGVIKQKKADQIFRDINIEINGFYLMNFLAYWSLRIGGFMAWNKHRKVNAKIK